MKLVITGASGFVGREIIPILLKAGVDLLLVGRDKKILQKLFPNMKIANYEDFESKAKNYHSLLHLAIRNNDKSGDIDEFGRANIENLKEIIHLAKNAGIKTFIYATSLHAGKKNITSPYAQRKFEEEKLLSNMEDMAIVKLRLPIVYGENYSERLKILTKIPKFLRKFLFDIFASLKPTVHIERLAQAIKQNINSTKNIELIITDQQKENWFYAFVKRIIDLGFAFFVAFFLWWLFIIVWLVIKLTSRGPGIFAQKRVGRDGKIFTCYKFRTMNVGTKQAGTHEISSSNITIIGKFLRKTKIDELPQIWNIFKNEMSLVGPRPCLPTQKELIERRMELGVYDVKAGITGWAQIKNIDMSNAKKLAKTDREYIDLRSLIFDLKIIIGTLI